jgi:hypothetical protein
MDSNPSTGAGRVADADDAEEDGGRELIGVAGDDGSTILLYTPKIKTLYDNHGVAAAPHSSPIIK